MALSYLEFALKLTAKLKHDSANSLFGFLVVKKCYIISIAFKLIISPYSYNLRLFL